MSKPNLIKIKDETPMIHFFVYKNKQFPIKYIFFKQYSKYFYDHRKEIQKNKIIQLVDNDIEDQYTFTDEIIHSFINYVHQQTISLDISNVVLLNYLANKYEVSQLIEATEEYIKSNHDQLSIEILLLHQDDTQFDTKAYEKSISDNFPLYIKNERLLKLNFPILYRIFIQFQSQTAENKKNPEIFDFLFKCLDNYGREASVLFANVSFGSDDIERMNHLVTKYSKVFDFHFINSEFLKALYEQQNEILKKQIDNQIRLETTNKQMMDKISEYEIRITSMAKEIDHLKEINKQQEIDKKNFEENLLKRIEKLEDSQNELKLEELKNKEIANSKIVELKYEKGNEFKGINSYLTKQTGGNIHDNKTIEISANSVNGDYAHPKCLVDYEKNNYYHSDNHGNNNKDPTDIEVCFDFKDKKVLITNYEIKNDRTGISLKNWVIEVSNDNSKWEIIDSHSDDSVFKNSDATVTFNTNKTNEFYRFVKLRQTGKNGRDDYLVIIRALEFYGKLKLP